MSGLSGLKAWRLAAGLTQADAAKLLGINYNVYALIEQRRLRPTEYQMSRLKEHFGDGVGALFEDVDPAVRLVAAS